jgi:excisionase family DNA binding protein
MTDEILTIKEVADYLKVAEKTIYRLAGSKKLPGFKVGGIWRFRKSEVDHWIDTQSRKSKFTKGNDNDSA